MPNFEPPNQALTLPKATQYLRRPHPQAPSGPQAPAKAGCDRIGVHELTITNWERNATVPAIRYIPAILRFLGYDPTDPQPQYLNALRRAQGARPVAAEDGREAGVDPATIKN